MDPVGPWSYAYNRLTNASGPFQTSGETGNADYSQLGGQVGSTGGGVPSTTSQLLLQAHSTSLTSSPFSPAGFLSPPPVGYESVFSPLFHHPNTKTAHFNQHRALASSMTTGKQPSEDLSSLRESYSASHQGLATSSSAYFDHQASSTSQSSSLAWPQANTQLPSPFGILPHESVTPGSVASKSATPDYPFHPFAVTQQSLASHFGVDYKSPSFATENKKSGSSQSSLTSSHKVATTTANTPSSASFFQPAGSSFSSTPGLTAGFSPNKSQQLASPQYSSASKSYNSGNSTPSIQQQQSCIVSSGSVSSKDYSISHSPRAPTSSLFPGSASSHDKQVSRSSNFIPPLIKPPQTTPPSVQTKAQTKIYPDLASGEQRVQRNENSHDSSQSSPISYAMMDSGSHRYPTTVPSASPTKVAQPSQSQRRDSNETFQHILNPQGSTYRHYPNTGATADNDYQSKSSTDTYGSSTPNGPDCAGGSNRRASPLTTHSQASPLGHVASPAYPMYNSPLASISSPSSLQSDSTATSQCAASSNYAKPAETQPSTVAPRSPSERPSASQSGNNQYPSVIRPLPTPEPTNKTPGFPNANACWESDRQAVGRSGKYPSTSYSEGTDPTLVNPAAATSQRSSSTERQCYDTTGHSTSLQDLSSCRGDPMSIVKNLQNLHHTSVPAEAKIASDEPRSPKAASKRRKSTDKTPVHNATESSDYYNRVPPPAHLNANQQQQNGGYFDFDRWNRPFGTTQSGLHHPGSYAGNQSLMSHHSSYFPAFHLGHSAAHTTQQSQEYSNPSADVNQSQFGNQPPVGSYPAPPAPVAAPVPVEENPKVIVPDIEDELKFLSEDTPPVGDKQEKKPANPATDFMASYLKFLQGEPDSPSPPSSKGNRKDAWPTSKAYQPSNGDKSGEVKVEATPTRRRGREKAPDPVYDPEDDPRYFPLPKTRDKRKSLDSDSDSDGPVDRQAQADEKEKKKKEAQPKEVTVKPGKGKRGRPRIHPPKPPKPEQPSKRKAEADPIVLPPRRETSRRKAKEKVNLQQFQQQENLDDFDIEVPDKGDSDSDPAWTPVAANPKSSDDESGRRRSGRKGGKHSSGRRRSRASRVGSAEDEPAGASSADEAKPAIRLVHRSHSSGRGRRPRSRKPGSGGNSLSGDNDADSGDDSSDMFPFRSGEFVVIKTDLKEEWPPIWRVDGRTLLQKYEPFDHEGETLYRNISTYSGWSSENKHIYRPVAVRFRLQNKSETLVEFLKDELVEDDDEILEKLMKETEIYQDNFEVYIQTLISQALDSNFLTEIFQEQDEYFLSNVKKIDEVTDERRQKFLSVAKWQPKLEASVATWPCYNVMAELSADEVKRECAACSKPKVSNRVLMYGQPYNSTTLEGSRPDPNVASDKAFLMCRLCAGRVELYNKVVHQKYLMFIECAKRVGEKRVVDPSKDTTAILNDMLADEKWLNQLFRKVRSSWAEIDRMERYAQMRNKEATTKD